MRGRNEKGRKRRSEGRNERRESSGEVGGGV